MRAKLNITIEKEVLANAKRFAIKNHTSLSKLIESHFIYITKDKPKKNILELLEDLPKPQKPLEGYIKSNYYNQRKNKYGF